MNGSRDRDGAVLLEVLVAMTIFAIASAATLVRAAEARHAVVAAYAAEARTERASAFLDRVVLWPREDLDRHLGTHAQGEWALTVVRVTPVLYSVALFDSSARRSRLETLLYRSAPRIAVQP